MELDYEQKRQIKGFADYMESNLEKKDKVHLVRQINDWAIGAWTVCIHLGLTEEAKRFDEVADAAKYRLKEFDDAEQDTDTLMGR